MSTLGILIIVGVVLLVALMFVGLVWLFVRLSRPQQPPPPEIRPAATRVTGQQTRQNIGKKSGRRRP